MTDILSVGLSGLRAYQTALTTTSENIANAGTAGYVRRSATVREVTAPSDRNGATMNGMGVQITGIGRATDAWRSLEVRATISDHARSEAGVTWLERIEGALTGDRLSDRLTAFFNAATTVAADPAATAPRAAMLESAATLAGVFTSTGHALDGAMADIDASFDSALAELNNLMGALGKVNTGLGRAAANSSGQAQLLDERDRLLEKMSGIVDLGLTFDTVGRTTARAGGEGGPVILAGDQPGIVTFVRNDEGAVSLMVHRNGESSSIQPSGGMLAGLIEAAPRIAEARTRLNAVATGFAEGMNGLQAAGDDLFGNPGAAMFAVGATPTDLSLTLSDPRGIAAAGRGRGMRDNANLASLAALRGSGGFEADVSAMVTSNASALAGRRAVAEAHSAIRDNAVAARDAVSGVNLDEEAVDLLRFQQAYQASSRVIQIARETLQTIFELR